MTRSYSASGWLRISSFGRRARISTSPRSRTLWFSSRNRFSVMAVAFDPWQLIGLSQRLRAAGVNMAEIPQTQANLTSATSCLFELFRGCNITLYADPDMREAVLNANVKE